MELRQVRLGSGLGADQGTGTSRVPEPSGLSNLVRGAATHRDKDPWGQSCFGRKIMKSGPETGPALREFAERDVHM